MSDRPTINPFSSRFIRPGANEFLFPAGVDAAALVERFEQLGRAQILGPHGSGKSTLLATLRPEFTRRGWDVRQTTLRDGQRRLPSELTLAGWHERTLVVIDGYEQLGWWSRWRLRRRLKRTGAGLLVTAHADTGCPTLYETTVSVELADRVIKRLAGECIIPRDELAQVLAQQHDNLREVLFGLYDRYDAGRAESSNGTP